MHRHRLSLIGGSLAFATGAASLVPITAHRLNGHPLTGLAYTVIALALLLILSGLFAAWRGFRQSNTALPPAPIRAVIISNILFLAFCAMETVDGLICQNGRILYWTTILYLPALLLLGGMTFARRWAWWLTRATAVLATLWFLGFMFLIPFAELRTQGVIVPLEGRIYMICVSFLFASVALYAFTSLGRHEARNYFAKPTTA